MEAGSTERLLDRWSSAGGPTASRPCPHGAGITSPRPPPSHSCPLFISHLGKLCPINTPNSDDGTPASTWRGLREACPLASLQSGVNLTTLQLHTQLHPYCRSEHVKNKGWFLSMHHYLIWEFIFTFPFFFSLVQK